MTKILFICAGNTCRSPMAAAAFRQLCAEAGLNGIESLSAGLHVTAGEPVSVQARFALHQAGIPDPGGVSRALSAAMIEAADRIAVMTASQRREVLGRWPEAAGKVRLLLSYAPAAEGDIADPAGGNSEAYIHCLESMLPALKRLVHDLRGAGI